MSQPVPEPELGGMVHFRHVSYDPMTYEPMSTDCVPAFVTKENELDPGLFVMAPDAAMPFPQVAHDPEGGNFTWHFADEFHGGQ